jgi:hypothetical protein
MPTESEFNSQVDWIGGHLQTFLDVEREEREVDDSADRTVVWEIDSPPAITHLVGAKSNNRYLDVIYGYDLLWDLVLFLDTDQSESIISKADAESVEALQEEVPELSNEASTDEEVNRERIQRDWVAANIRIKSVSRESNTNLIIRLNEIFSEGPLTYSIERSEEDRFREFTLFHQLFPYEGDLRTQDVYDSIRLVKSSGHYAANLLRYSFGIRSNIEETEPIPERLNWPDF